MRNLIVNAAILLVVGSSIPSPCIAAPLSNAAKQGLQLLGQGKDLQAISFLNKEIAKNSKDPSLFEIRGHAYQSLSNSDGKDVEKYRALLEKSITDFNTAIRLAPQDAELYRYRGEAYSDQNDADKAVKDFDKAIALDPKSHDSYTGRAHALSLKDEFKPAIADCDKAISLINKRNWAQLANAYTVRGSIRCKDGQLEKCVADCDTALSVIPINTKNGIVAGVRASAYYERAKAYKKLGKSDLANKDLQTAHKLGYPTDVIDN